MNMAALFFNEGFAEYAQGIEFAIMEGLVSEFGFERYPRYMIDITEMIHGEIVVTIIDAKAHSDDKDIG